MCIWFSFPSASWIITQTKKIVFFSAELEFPLPLKRSFAVLIPKPMLIDQRHCFYLCAVCEWTNEWVIAKVLSFIVPWILLIPQSFVSLLVFSCIQPSCLMTNEQKTAKFNLFKIISSNFPVNMRICLSSEEIPRTASERDEPSWVVLMDRYFMQIKWLQQTHVILCFFLASLCARHWTWSIFLRFSSFGKILKVFFSLVVT